MDLLILQVAFRFETFPAVLERFGHTPLVAFGRKSPRTGWLRGMETPSGSRSGFFLSWAFFQNLFTVLFPYGIRRW